jgi:DMSO/TMAO reductase YedYZ molybdopterin-dependent catalytic subunit
MGITRRSLFSIAPVAWAAGRNHRISRFRCKTVEGVITPSDRFFVRDHFAEPEVSLRDWSLKIEGRVARPLELSFADLLEAPTKKAEVVLECAGNAAAGTGRSI